MQEKNMTALVSCFARAYHYESNEYKIFSDNLAKELLTQEEYQNISKNMVTMTMGIDDNKGQVCNLSHHLKQVFSAISCINHRSFCGAQNHIAQ